MLNQNHGLKVLNIIKCVNRFVVAANQPVKMKNVFFFRQQSDRKPNILTLSQHNSGKRRLEAPAGCRWFSALIRAGKQHITSSEMFSDKKLCLHPVSEFSRNKKKSVTNWDK